MTEEEKDTLRRDPRVREILDEEADAIRSAVARHAEPIDGTPYLCGPRAWLRVIDRTVADRRAGSHRYESEIQSLALDLIATLGRAMCEIRALEWTADQSDDEDVRESARRVSIAYADALHNVGTFIPSYRTGDMQSARADMDHLLGRLYRFRNEGKTRESLDLSQTVEDLIGICMRLSSALEGRE